MTESEELRATLSALIPDNARLVAASGARMPPSYKKMLLHFLEELGDHQSNAGCNDFDLSSFVPDVEERRAIMKAFHEYNGDPECFEEDLADGKTFKYTEDFCIVGLLKDWITKNA
jgi:hypothetical protein